MKASTNSEENGVLEVRTESAEETRRFGVSLAGVLPVPGVVLLHGLLGMGKTTLARGIAEGLGLADPADVHSPSFTLVNIYSGRVPIYHVDLYRLEKDSDFDSLGLEDFLGREGVTIVEWGERLPFSPGKAVHVTLLDAGEDSRILRVEGMGLKRRRALKTDEGPRATALSVNLRPPTRGEGKP